MCYRFIFIVSSLIATPTVQACAQQTYAQKRQDVGFRYRNLKPLDDTSISPFLNLYLGSLEILTDEDIAASYIIGTGRQTGKQAASQFEIEHSENRVVDGKVETVVMGSCVTLKGNEVLIGKQLVNDPYDLITV